jgi:hypothetical protein
MPKTLDTNLVISNGRVRESFYLTCVRVQESHVVTVNEAEDTVAGTDNGNVGYAFLEREKVEWD